MAAEAATGKILASYPDYGKAPKEYLASIMQAIGGYPVEVITQLADPKIGIPARCKFLPSVGDIAELGDRLEAELAAIRSAAAPPKPKPERRVYSMAEYREMRFGPPISARFRPFPKLWEEFGDEFMGFPDFDLAMAASKALATKGRDEALAILQARPRGQSSDEPKPAGAPYVPIPPKAKPSLQADFREWLDSAR